MTGIKFKYRLDRRAKIITWSVLGTIALAGGLLWLFSPGGYLPAWFSSIAVAMLTLCALSIPRSIRVTPDAIEIRCTVEITHIPYGHIRGVRRVECTELRPLVPLFASPGFFGYFGYWLDLRGRDTVKFYATSRQGLVVIENIYEQRYVVSVDEPDELVGKIEDKMKNKG